MDNRRRVGPHKWGCSNQPSQIFLRQRRKNRFVRGLFRLSRSFWTGTGQNVSNLGNLKILAIVKDKGNEICGENDFDLPDINDSAGKNQIIDVVMEKRCENASYSVSIHSGEKKLAEESGELPKVVEERNTSPYLYFGLPALMILLAFVFFRKRKIVPIHLLVILFAGVTMFFGTALAGTQTYPEWGGMTGTYRWGGDWTLDSGTERLKSNPEGGGGLNTLRVFPQMLI